MKNIPTFLKFSNERAAPGRAFVLHTGRPAFLAEVHSFETETEVIGFGKEFMQQCEASGAPCLGSRSRKPWDGRHYFFAVIAIFESFETTQKEANRLARLIRRMADWYLYNVLNAKP